MKHIIRSTVLMLLLLAVPFAAADSSQHDVISAEHVAAALEDIKCKADYTVGLLNAVNPTSTQIAAIQQDVTQLQSYADKSDIDGFRSYVKDTFDKHLRDARESARTSHQSTRYGSMKNETNMTSTQVDRQKLRADYDECHKNAMMKYANGKVTAYTAIIDNYNRRATELSSKGIDTSGLTSLLHDAKTQIVEPLKAALQQATTAQDVHAALQKYCLFDGCKNGTNFHLAAKFELAKLSAVLNYLKAQPNAPADKVKDAQTAIGIAKAALDKVGTARYAPGQAQQVWSQIEDAAKAVKEIRSSMRSS